VTDDAAGWDPLILAVAPNGARKTKVDHPELPLTPEEIGRTAATCREAGAAMIHLHVRDENGRHSLDAERYRAAIAAIEREAGGDFPVQVTSEAGGRYQRAEQMAMTRELRPEFVSMAVREIVPDAESETEAAEFFAWMAREGISPQYILYDAEDLARFRDLMARGIVPDARPFVLFVLGRYSAAGTSEPSELLPFLEGGAPEHPWALCAFGPKEAACALTAAALGGHARVGFENNLQLPDGTTAPDNAALIAAVAQGAAVLGRPLATPGEARQLLGR
jgi:uncharacterized protein (DUF849 family)